MFGASGIKVLKFILKGNSLDLGQLTLLLVAMIVAFGVSMYVIRFLTDYVKKHDFTVFGKYRIGLGTLFIGFLRLCLQNKPKELGCQLFSFEIKKKTDFNL